MDWSRMKDKLTNAKEIIIKKNCTNDEHFVLSDIMDPDIADCTSVVRFEPDEVIMEEGTRPEYLLYLVSGRAKLYLSHDNGRITLINFLSAPCFIGEMELLDEDRLASGVKAITVCECYAIRLDECRDKLLEDTKFLRYTCRFLSRKAIGNTTNYSLNQSYPLKNRLASFMLETSIGGYYREPHGEVAEYLGVTYRHLLYVIAEFAKEGLIEKTPSGYKLLNVDKIRSMIKG